MRNFIVLLFLFLSVCMYSQTKHKDGLFQDYYKNDQLKKEGYYKDNNKIGAWKSYYDTGQLKSIYDYDLNGKLSGVKELYSKEGVLTSATTRAKNGGLIVKHFYDNGKLKITYDLKQNADKTGYQRVGGYKEFYKNDSLKVESRYENNELSGFWKRYLNSGEKEWEVQYLKGYKQGVYKQFYKNGTVKVEGGHDLGLKSGEEKIYDSLGVELYRLKYKKGVLKKTKQAPNATEVLVPDGVIEHVPIYPGCNLLTTYYRNLCMSQKVQNFVKERFNTSFAKELGLTGRQPIKVIFKIDKTGAVTDIRARANHKALEAEAIRVISLLPKITPGYQYGKPVTVPYSLPIVFHLGIKK